jgi:hypothetical protein
MPRRQKQRQNRRSGKNSRSFAMSQNPLIQSVGSPEKVLIRGKAYVNFSFASSAIAVWPVHPLNFGGHLVDITDAYDQYRFTKLRLIFSGLQFGGSPTTVVCCYQPNTSFATVTTITEATEQVVSAISFGGDTIPAVLEVPRSALLSTTTKWFPTNTSITSVPVIQAGIIAAIPSASSGTITMATVFEYECEFNMPCDPSARARAPLQRSPAPDAEEKKSPNIQSQVEFPTLGVPSPAKPTNWLGVFTSK